MKLYNCDTKVQYPNCEVYPKPTNVKRETQNNEMS